MPVFFRTHLISLSVFVSVIAVSHLAFFREYKPISQNPAREHKAESGTITLEIPEQLVSRHDLAPGVLLKQPAVNGDIRIIQYYSFPDRININTAPARLLTVLPGIGPSIADSIVQFRQENGPYNSPDDLTKVSGITIHTVAKIINFIATNSSKKSDNL